MNPHKNKMTMISISQGDLGGRYNAQSDAAAAIRAGPINARRREALNCMANAIAQAPDSS